MTDKRFPEVDKILSLNAVVNQMSPMKEVLILLFIICSLEESSFFTDWNYSSQYSLQTCPCMFVCIHLGIVHSPHTHIHHTSL